MNIKILANILYLTFMLFGCSTATVTPNIQADPTETNATAKTLPAPSATLEPDFPEGCVNLTETPLDTTVLNGLLIVANKYGNDYFFDPKSNQILDIEEKRKLSAVDPDADNITARVRPDKKFMQVSLIGKSHNIIRTV